MLVLLLVSTYIIGPTRDL